jgi:cutinase
VSDQHGSSTFSQTLVEALQRATAQRLAAAAPPPPPPPGAPAPVSSGDTWTIVVGGFNDPQGTVFTGDVDARVVYSAALTGASTREGVDQLNRMVREHRAAHPGDHIKIVGYSQGAAVVHTWTTENAGTVDNVNSVLIADPKRAAGPGGTGISGHPVTGIVGSPTSGADRNFGNIPTVSVCTNDVICDTNAQSGLAGYPREHGNYSFNVNDYSNTGNGQWFNGQFYPR